MVVGAAVVVVDVVAGAAVVVVVGAAVVVVDVVVGAAVVVVDVVVGAAVVVDDIVVGAVVELDGVAVVLGVVVVVGPAVVEGDEVGVGVERRRGAVVDGAVVVDDVVPGGPNRSIPKALSNARADGMSAAEASGSPIEKAALPRRANTSDVALGAPVVETGSTTTVSASMSTSLMIDCARTVTSPTTSTTSTTSVPFAAARITAPLIPILSSADNPFIPCDPAVHVIRMTQSNGGIAEFLNPD